MGRMVLAGMAVLFSVSGAMAGERDTRLIESFRNLCTRAAPVFAQIDQTASAMRLAVIQDLNPPPRPEASMHQKLWLVPLPSGEHALMAIEVRGPDAGLSGCGILAEDVNAPTFRPTLMAALGLGRPSAETAAPDGSVRIVRWDGVFGPGSALQLRQGGRMGGLDYQVRVAPR